MREGERQGEGGFDEFSDALHESLGPPGIPEGGFSALPPGERDLRFNEYMESKGMDLNRIPDILNRPDVRDDPVLARYAIRPFLFRADRLAGVHEAALKQEGFAGSPADAALNEYMPAARELGDEMQAMHGAKEGSGPGAGIEIEVMNDERWELRTPAVRDSRPLLRFVDALDDTYREMRNEIMQQDDGRERVVSVYDNVHVNAGIESPQALDRLHQDIKQRRGPYQLLTTVGVLANPTGRLQYFAERWWESNPLSPVSVEYEDTELGDAGRLQNRLWSFSFHKKNRPEFALMLRLMQHITTEYAEDPEGMRDALEEASADIIEEIQQIDREVETDGSRYSELFDVDPKSLALLPDPHRIARLRSNSPSLPGRWEMYRFAAKRIAELLPKEQEDVKGTTDNLLARMDEVLSGKEEADG